MITVAVAPRTPLERCGDPAFLRCEESWVETHPAGRVCAHPGCQTRLSVYNPGDHCGLHVPEPSLTYLGVPFALCECGAVIHATNKNAKGRCRSCAVKATAEARRLRTLRRDGTPDSIQKAQQKARAAS